MVIEQKINKFFGDDESTGFGTGWWSGILSAFFGFLSFGGVLCLHFPQLLSSPELRPHYLMHTTRVLIQCLILAAILSGVISSILPKNKTLSLTWILLAISANSFVGSISRVYRSDPLAVANFPAYCGCGRYGVFCSFGVPQSAFSLAFSCRSPFFESAGLDRRLTLPLCGRHTGPRTCPCSSHAWIFAIGHPCVFDLCHSSRHLGSLQFRPQREMARKVPGYAQISSLAPYFSKRGHRQKLCYSFSVD